MQKNVFPVQKDFQEFGSRLDFSLIIVEVLPVYKEQKGRGRESAFITVQYVAKRVV